MSAAAAFPAPVVQSVPVPKRLQDLPVERGFIVPWFVQWINNKPEFRLMDKGKLYFAVEHKVCWVCGKSLKGSVNPPFVVGPMCTVNRISAEPPSHAECARYAARVCPFLARPHMQRREITDDAMQTHITRSEAAIHNNPGVTALYFTREFSMISDGRVPLFVLGPPAGVEWYAKGGPATRTQVEEAFEKGVLLLRKDAAAEGKQTLDDFDRRTVRARAYWPKK
jgi:hypothetical protein